MTALNAPRSGTSPSDERNGETHDRAPSAGLTDSQVDADLALPVLGGIPRPALAPRRPGGLRPAEAAPAAPAPAAATVPPGPETELVQLVDLAKEGNVEAWERLYRRAYPNLIRYVRRRVTVREEAGDVVSETFARAFHGIRQFTWRGAGFDAWLYGICRNVIREGQRMERRGEPQVTWVESGCDEPLEYVLHNEEAVALRAALASLDCADRELLELRVVAGLSSEEVGAVLGKRPAAVRMAQSRALSRLRAALASRHADGSGPGPRTNGNGNGNGHRPVAGTARPPGPGTGGVAPWR